MKFIWPGQRKSRFSRFFFRCIDSDCLCGCHCFHAVLLRLNRFSSTLLFLFTSFIFRLICLCLDNAIYLRKICFVKTSNFCFREKGAFLNLLRFLGGYCHVLGAYLSDVMNISNLCLNNGFLSNVTSTFALSTFSWAW